MRREFADTLLEEAKKNKNIILLTGDLGYKMFDQHKIDFPDRALSVGASEQAMMDIAVGLAYSGKIPVVYSITPFLLYRPFETIRTYVNYEELNIKLIGGGRNDDYKHDGISHDATDASFILNTLPNVVQFWPKDGTEIPDMTRELLNNNKPSFISLRR